MRIHSIVHRLLALGVLGACIAPVARAADADVVQALKLIPVDIPLVLVISNPQGLDKTVQAIAQSIDPDGDADSITEDLIENVPFGKHIDLTKLLVTTPGNVD